MGRLESETRRAVRYGETSFDVLSCLHVYELLSYHWVDYVVTLAFCLLWLPEDWSKSKVLRVRTEGGCDSACALPLSA